MLLVHHLGPWSSQPGLCLRNAGQQETPGAGGSVFLGAFLPACILRALNSGVAAEQWWICGWVSDPIRAAVSSKICFTRKSFWFPQGTGSKTQSEHRGKERERGDP